MKKYPFATTLFLIVIISKTTAQSFIGIKGGLSIPNLSAGGSDKNPINTGYSSRTGPDFAAFYEAGFSKTFSLSTQLEYSAQGGKKNGLQAISTEDIPGISQYFTAQQRPVPTYIYADYKSEAKINYLMLSELAKANFQLGSKSPFSAYIDAGPFGGFLVAAHQVTSGSSDIYADENKQENITENTHRASNHSIIKTI